MSKVGMASRDMFRSLGVRNFRLFFTGQFVSQVGNWMTMVALTLLVLDRTGSGVAVGLLVACQFAPVLFVGAWAGLIADRSDKRRLLIVVQLVSTIQSFSLAALAFLPAAPIASFFVVAGLGGFATAFDNPTRRALSVELVPESHVQNAVSLNTAVQTSSRIFGPALAGILINTIGYGWCFLADSISYFAVLASLWMIDTADIRRPSVVPRGRGQVRAGLRYVREVPVLWISLVMMAVVGTFTFNFPVVFPLFVTRSLHGSTSTYTYLYSVISVGAVIGALAFARRKTTEIGEIVGITASYGAAMGLFALAPNLAVAFPVAVLVGLTSIAFMTTSTAIVQLRAEPLMRGRVLALQAMVFLGSTPIGGPILGFVCDILGPRAGIGLGALAAGGAAVWGGCMSRRVRPAPGVGADLDMVVSAIELTVAT